VGRLEVLAAILVAQTAAKIPRAGEGVRIPEFCANQDRYTDPGELAGLYDDLPDAPAELREIVSQLISHVSLEERL